MAQIGIKELLEAGVHFGHQTRRWNPKMRRFIFGERDGIYIIDLLQTEALLRGRAPVRLASVARRGGTVLFVGTKKQARDAIQETADAAEMPYVNHRWLGGLLTNFQTISLRIKRLHDLERYETEGQLQLLPTRERMAAQADLEKLRANLGGVKNMQRVPDAVFVIDLKTEAIAVREAQRLRIPIIGLVDTNCDPDGIDYVIPGNDDAIRSCAAITSAIGDVVAQGHGVFRAEEEARAARARAPGGRGAGPPRGRGAGPPRGRGARARLRQAQRGGRGAGAAGRRGGCRSRRRRKRPSRRQPAQAAARAGAEPGAEPAACGPGSGAAPEAPARGTLRRPRPRRGGRRRVGPGARRRRRPRSPSRRRAAAAPEPEPAPRRPGGPSRRRGGPEPPAEAADADRAGTRGRRAEEQQS